MPPRKRLGQLLTELGVIDDHQLQSALGHQRQWGGKLGGILVQKGFCAEEQLVSALAQHLNMPRVKLAEAKIDPRAVKMVSRQIAEKLHVFPYEVSGSGRSEVISIAMSDPTDLSAVDQLAFHTGKRIKPMLASDSEVVGAIQGHYGPAEEKKEATDKVARPVVTPQPPAAAPGFPKRIEPAAPAAAPAAQRPAPAAPAAAATAAAEPAKPVTAAPPPPPAPVELPEDDAEDLGLEPIAAHSQFGDAVSGQEDVAGDGSAGDAIEGLVSASLAHEGVDEAKGAGSPEAAWPEVTDPAPQQDPGWGTPVQATGEGWGPPSSEPAAVTWGAEPAAPAGWSMEEPSTSAGWSAPESGQAWSEVPGPPDEPPSEALPTDAILGALEASPDAAGETSASGWEVDEEQAAADASGQAAPAEAPPVRSEAPEESEDVAIEAEAPAESDLESAVAEPVPPPFEPEPEDGAAAEAAPEPEPIPEIVAPPEDDSPAPLDEGAVRESEIAASPQIDTEPIPAPTFAEAATDHEAEAPDAWAASEDPLAADAHQHEAAWREVEANAEAALHAATQEFEAPAPPAAHDEAGAPGQGEERESEAIEVDTASFEDAQHSPPAAGEQEESWNAAPATEEMAAPPESTERFVAEPPAEAPAWSGSAEPEPQDARWMGEGLGGATPLSPADLGTLASIGIAPEDGVGALRLLATLVRILNRNQLIEPDELRAEIRESRAAGAAAAAVEPEEAGPQRRPPAGTGETGAET